MRQGNLPHLFDYLKSNLSLDITVCGRRRVGIGCVFCVRYAAWSYRQAINANGYDIWAVGGLIGYDFGPAALKVWGFQELSATASGESPFVLGHDPASITKGFKVFANLSFRIWAPSEELQSPRFTK